MEKKEYKSSFQKVWFKVLVAMVISIVLVMSFSKVYPITKVEEGDSLETFSKYLDNCIPKIMEAYHIPGANIVLVKEGEMVWAKAYGYADLKEERKMTRDTYLRVESISKPVTAWGIMKLVEQGKIELDKPVKEYLKSWDFPKSRYSEKNITVRQLLNHTSGLPLGDFNNRFSPIQSIPTLKDSLTKEAVLEREPGVEFYYSNTGFNLLELLIEEVTGEEFSRYMEREVLIPLGMNHSSFTWSKEFNPPIPNGYDLTGKPIPVYVYPEKGSGGLFATAEDIATFVVAGMPHFSTSKQVLGLESIQMLYTPSVEKIGVYNLVFDSYGLGHYIENLSQGYQAVSHGGQGAGWMTHFHSVPETGDGIIILTNSQRSWPFIAYLLRDWAKWCGHGTVGMGCIIWAIVVLWICIGLIWFASLLQIWKLAEGMMTKERRFTSLKNNYTPLGIVQICLSIIILAGLWWCVGQDYLFFTSVFPIVSHWLGISLFILATVMLLSAFIPKKDQELEME